jgi:hypothetical protein
MKKKKRKKTFPFTIASKRIKYLGINLTKEAEHQWLMPIIPATQEAETRKIKVPIQPGQTVHETLS